MTREVWQLFLYRTESGVTVRAIRPGGRLAPATLHDLARRFPSLQRAAVSGRSMMVVWAWPVIEEVRIGYLRKRLTGWAAPQIPRVSETAVSRARTNTPPRREPR